MATAPDQIPEELSPRRVGRRLLELCAVVALIVLFVVVGPGLSGLRNLLAHAGPGWIAAGIGLEVLSALSYVVVFRAVFCPRMSWQLSYQIGMAEQAANSVLSVSGAGGLALGVWALRRGGMSVEHIGRRTVAFFFLTSMANVFSVIVFAFLYGVGILHGHGANALTYAFGAAALAGTAIALALPRLLGDDDQQRTDRAGAGRVARLLRFARHSLAQGLRDAVMLLRQRSVGVLVGSFGVMIFDVMVLGVGFRAVGSSPSIGVLSLGYLIGQLGGNLPIPGGIGGVDAGLIGTFALYHQPVEQATAAVLIYHAIALWVPALLGSVAFVQLRRTLQRETHPAAMCAPLAEPLELVHEALVPGKA